MQKTTVSAVALVAFLAMTAPAQAQGLLSLPKALQVDASIKGEVRSDRQEVRSEVRAKAEIKKDERKEKSEQKRKDSVKKFWTNATNRLSKLLTSELRLADKIGKRLDEAASKGRNVTTQKAALVTAKASIATVQQSVKDASVQVEVILADTALSAKEITTKLRALHKGVLEKIRLSHKLLVDVVVSMRGLKTSASVSPTPTQ